MSPRPSSSARGGPSIGPGGLMMLGPPDRLLPSEERQSPQTQINHGQGVPNYREAHGQARGRERREGSQATRTDEARRLIEEYVDDLREFIKTLRGRLN